MTCVSAETWSDAALDNPMQQEVSFAGEDGRGQAWGSGGVGGTELEYRSVMLTHDIP